MTSELIKKEDEEKAAIQARVEDLTKKALDFVDASLSDATRRAYTRQWRQYTIWCEENNFPTEPIEDKDNAVSCCGLYLAFLADEGKKVSTIEQAMAAITLAYVSRDLESPSTSRKIAKLMKGIRNKVGVLQDKKKPIELEDLYRMVDQCGPSLLGIRDRAMLLLGFLGAFRRSELVAIELKDIKVIEGGLRINLPRSKTDQAGAGRDVIIPRSKNPLMCPALALIDWLSVTGITEGPLFRRVYKDGRIAKRGLQGKVVAYMVKKYAEKVGIEPEDFAGHSLRAGYVTSAAKRGAQSWEIMKTTGHKSVQTLQGYIRTENTVDAAAKKFNL